MYVYIYIHIYIYVYMYILYVYIYIHMLQYRLQYSHFVDIIQSLAADCVYFGFCQANNTTIGDNIPVEELDDDEQFQHVDLVSTLFFKHISCVFQVLILNFRVFVTRDLWNRPGGLSPAS